MPENERRAAPLDQFVRSRTRRRGPNECWAWTGAFTKSGLPAMALRIRDYDEHDLLQEFGIDYDTKNPAIRRIVYGLTFGSVPYDMMVFMTCDNLQCVNPNHMYISDSMGSAEVRNRRGTVCRGEQAWKATLTEQQVREIFARIQNSEDQVVIRDLAREYNVRPNVITAIKRGDAWGSVTGVAMPEGTKQSLARVRKAQRKGSRFAVRD